MADAGAWAVVATTGEGKNQINFFSSGLESFPTKFIGLLSASSAENGDDGMRGKGRRMRKTREEMGVSVRDVCGRLGKKKV